LREPITADLDESVAHRALKWFVGLIEGPDAPGEPSQIFLKSLGRR
jgi:hypothetical protein